MLYLLSLLHLLLNKLWVALFLQYTTLWALSFQKAHMRFVRKVSSWLAGGRAAEAKGTGAMLRLLKHWTSQAALLCKGTKCRVNFRWAKKASHSRSSLRAGS